MSRNRRWWLLATLAASITAGPAAAESLEEKICVFSSAERLPVIAGLAITSTSVASVPVASVTPDVVGWFSDPIRASEEINRRFRIGTAERDLAIRRSVSKGDNAAANSALTAALNAKMVGGARAEITVHALGRDAVFGFACIWTTTRLLVSAPLGVVR